MSGSLWFPDFREYVFSHEMKRNPECIYFSLGDRECRTGNPYLKVVQERTEEMEAFYRGKGIDTEAIRAATRKIRSAGRRRGLRGF